MTGRTFVSHLLPLAFATAVLLFCGGCAQIAEKAVNSAIKHCLTVDGFSDARQCQKR